MNFTFTLGLPQRTRERGSVLIIALLFAAAIAVSIGSYMALATTSLKTANRSFYMNAALNLAETGVEEALWCFNQMHAGVPAATAWTGAGWTTPTPLTTGVDGIATRTFSGFTLAGGTTGSVKVYVDHANPSGLTSPKALALATILIPNSTPIIKEIQVTLSRRSYFAMGMVAENTITFNGNNAMVDSWNSKINDDGTPRGSPVAYSAPWSVGDHRNYDRPRPAGSPPPNANAKGSVGAGSAINSALSVQNADIYGTASVGSSNPSAGISTGPNGTVQAAPPAPRPADGEDPALISGGFNPQLEVPEAPTVAGAPITSFGSTLGSASTTILVRSIVGITGKLDVYGDVTLVIDVAPGVAAIDLTGNSSQNLTITAGSSLVIYSKGDIKAAGQAGINVLSAQPIGFQFYGTSTSVSPRQDIKVGGGAAFKGAIYAPKATIDLKGNSEYQGSIVGYQISVGGGAIFHYDESMANFGENVPYGPSDWKEITSATDRAAVASLLSF